MKLMIQMNRYPIVVALIKYNLDIENYTNDILSQINRKYECYGFKIFKIELI